MIRVFVVFGATAAAAWLAVALCRQWALRRRLLDVPNARSSHSVPVPRFGGLGFVPILLAAAILAPGNAGPGAAGWIAAAGAAMIFGLGIVDDWRALSAKVRLATQCAVVAGALSAAAFFAGDRLGLPHGPAAWWLLGPLFLFGVGFINAFNFMDGVNGMAGLQGLVYGLAWAALGWWADAGVAAWFGLAMAAGMAGFLPQNINPAKVFMGDGGSTVLGFLAASLPWIAAAEPGSGLGLGIWLHAGVLMTWAFWSDVAFTMAARIRRGENILEAHRTHLYQRLVRAGWRHEAVSGLYAALAAVGVLMAWFYVAAPSPARLAGLLGGALPAMFLALRQLVLAAERRAAAGR